MQVYPQTKRHPMDCFGQKVQMSVHLGNVILGHSHVISTFDDLRQSLLNGQFLKFKNAGKVTAREACELVRTVFVIDECSCGLCDDSPRRTHCPKCGQIVTLARELR